VSISSYFQKELGISWGGSFVADPQHGNPLDFRFPYTVNADGFGVNLPGVTDPVFSTGDIRFGSIDDVVAIFARIDAAERENKTKTLGQPKIFTQDNVPANVSAGQVRRITEVTTSGNTTTTTTREVEATLSLNVTPRVSNDGYISMTVSVSNDAFTGASGTDTRTQSVNSEITVKDGETVVIGGIYQTTEAENSEAVPYLHKIPLIGRLFKSTLPNINEKTELLIFLTPRILDRQFLQSDQEGTNVSLVY
jgi:type IV pilus assembly protein PilQ